MMGVKPMEVTPVILRSISIEIPMGYVAIREEDGNPAMLRLQWYQGLPEGGQQPSHLEALIPRAMLLGMLTPNDPPAVGFQLPAVAAPITDSDI